jgi:hypothetical protein
LSTISRGRLADEPVQSLTVLHRFDGNAGALGGALPADQAAQRLSPAVELGSYGEFMSGK